MPSSNLLSSMLAIGFGNSRPVIADAEQHGIALAPRLDQDLLGACGNGRVQRLHYRRWLAVFDRVLDQIGERLADQLTVAMFF